MLSGINILIAAALFHATNITAIGLIAPVATAAVEADTPCIGRVSPGGRPVIEGRSVGKAAFDSRRVARIYYSL